MATVEFLPGSWEEAIYEVAADTLLGTVPMAAHKDFSSQLHSKDLVAEAVKWAHDYWQLGDHRGAIQELRRALVRALAQVGSTPSYDLDYVVRTVIGKQHDYGHGNIMRHGFFGVIVRMDDKIARLENLLKGSSGPRNESVLDSWVDLVGYSLVGIMLLEGTFIRELSRDLR